MRDYQDVPHESEESVISHDDDKRYQILKGLLNQSGDVPAMPLLQIASDPVFHIRESALNRLCEISHETLFPVLESSLRNHDDADLRNAAMEVFRRYDAVATVALTGLLDDTDEEVRMFSVQLLGDRRDAAAVDAIVSLLKDSDENVRHASAEALGAIGNHRAVSPLIMALDDSFWVQFPAIQALGKLREPSSVDHLLPLLADDMLQQAVIEALGRIGDSRAIPGLLPLLGEPDCFYRNEILSALLAIQTATKINDQQTNPDFSEAIRQTLHQDDLIDHLLNSLSDADLSVRKNALIALGWLREERAIRPLIAMANDFDLDEFIIGALVSIGKAAVPDLLEALSSAIPEKKVILLQILGWIEDDDGLQGCRAYLHDENPDVRSQAIIAVSASLNNDMIEQELLSLCLDDDLSVRRTVLEILSKSRSPRLISTLIDTIHSDNHHEQLMSIELLGRLKASEIVKELVELSEHPRDDIRVAVFHALANLDHDLRDPEIVHRGIRDASPAVRKAASRCITATMFAGMKESISQLLRDPDPDIRIALMTILSEGENSIEFDQLCSCYPDQDKRVNLALITAIGHTNDRAACSFLSELLKGSDTDIRRFAIEALQSLHDSRALPTLMVLLDDMDWVVRNSAVIAIGDLGDRRSVRYLIRKLTDREDIIKRSALNALMTIGDPLASEAILPLLYNENLATDAILALERLGFHNPDTFYSFFKSASTRVKGLLLESAGRLQVPGIRNFLVSVLEHEFFTLRCQAAKVLGDLKDSMAIPALLKIRKTDPSNEVRDEISQALKKIGTH